MRNSLPKLIVTLGVALAVPLSVQAQTNSPAAGPAMAPAVAPSVAAPDAQPAPSPDYILGPDDVVDVEVLGRADFKTRARIGADGTIQLPLIGRIAAGDRTARALSEQVRAALQAGGYFASPIVNVEVVSYSSRYVTVLGAVTSPGLVTVNRSYRLSEILARVGGVSSAGADYIILRPADGSPEKRLLIKDLATGDPSQDPVVGAGDKIFAPQAELFYISGQVNSPGSYAVATGLTYRLAIAKAGGLGPAGSDRRLKVTRAGENLKVNLDDKVEPGDVIVIGERLF